MARAAADRGRRARRRCTTGTSGTPVERELLELVEPAWALGEGGPRAVRCAGAARSSGKAGDDVVVRQGKGAPCGGSPFFRWPPTELADGFGREAALQARDVRPRSAIHPSTAVGPRFAVEATRRRPLGLP
ncbi:hypothetical protein GCM10027451_29420 [Geodermatophilus aquaeductus]